MTGRLLVLDVVGLTPRLLAQMPNLGTVADRGFQAELGAVLPAVTCTAQATFLTGTLPREHGIVGNGWYFRDLGEPLFWRQHNALVAGDKLWDVARRSRPGFSVANVCWWYAMGAQTETLVTPRPIYYADGRKAADCYTRPPALHDELLAELGPFPLFNYWGPAAGIASSAWIAKATQLLLHRYPADLTLAYLPHLDYDLQRYGPYSPAAEAAAHDLDDVLGPLLAAARSLDLTVVALSEYGMAEVSRPVDINRALRRAGLLEVYVQDGMEYLDPWVSPAFAVADHQVAHVYVREPAQVAQVAALIGELAGVAAVLDEAGKHAAGLDHPRAGELVILADSDSWFTYYYWLDDARAPDFARTVDIHRKPGYDPAELFRDPADRTVKIRALSALARKRLGLRYTMSVVPLDPAPVRGSHGRLPGDRMDGPVLVCSDPALRRDRIEATEVRDLLLALVGCPVAPRAGAHRAPATSG